MCSVKTENALYRTVRDELDSVYILNFMASRVLLLYPHYNALHYGLLHEIVHILSTFFFLFNFLRFL